MKYHWTDLTYQQRMLHNQLWTNALMEYINTIMSYWNLFFWHFNLYQLIALINNLAPDKLRIFYFIPEIKCMMMMQLKRNISSFNSRLNLRRLMPEYIILRNKCSGRWRSFFYNITLYLHTTRNLSWKLDRNTFLSGHEEWIISTYTYLFE